jgi:MFS family permease
LAFLLAPILDPTLGGWITDNYSWRWFFYLNLPVGIDASWGIMRLTGGGTHIENRVVGCFELKTSCYRKSSDRLL